MTCVLSVLTVQCMALQASKEGAEPLTGKQPGVLSTEGSSAVRCYVRALPCELSRLQHSAARGIQYIPCRPVGINANSACDEEAEWG